jgi:hypothetical protein
MFIIVPAERSLTLTGECRKSLVCEMCERKYSYILQRTIQVRQNFFSLSYSDKAVLAELRAKGEKKLATILENNLDVAPCPTCGWVQQTMIAYREKHALQWMKTIALISLLSGIALGIMFFVLGFIDRIEDAGYYYFAALVANFGIFCALAFWSFRWLCLRLTDPNRDYGRIDTADSESANDEVEPRQ